MSKKIVEQTFSLVGICIFLTFIFAGCGGGGGGNPVVQIPTDSTTIVTTTSKHSVRAVANIINPTADMTSPTKLGRISAQTAERIAGRMLDSITSNLDQLNGNVSEKFYITYTNEPLANCILNGTLNGQITQSTDTNMDISLSGTINYTQCSNIRDFTAEIKNGVLSGTETTMTMTMPSTYTFSGKQYTATMTSTINFTFQQDVLVLNQLSYTGSDSLNNTFNHKVTYETVSEGSWLISRPKLYTNKNVIDSATNNISCSFNHTNKTISCSGTSSLSNGIVLTYSQDSMIFSFSENSSYPSSSVKVIYYTLTSGNSSFTTNTGYSGTLTFNPTGSGTGVIKDASNVVVANMSWNNSGYCTINYIDVSISDTQFYLSNIMEALA